MIFPGCIFESTNSPTSQTNPKICRLKDAMMLLFDKFQWVDMGVVFNY